MPRAIPDVLESAQFIASKANNVSISEEAVEKAANLLCGLNTFQRPLPRPEEAIFEPAGLTDCQLVEWLFVVDTVNFCFWAEPGAELFTVDYRTSCWTGSRAMSAALANAVDQGIPIYSPSFYGSVTLEQLKEIFKSTSTSNIPLLEERIECLHEAATVLKKEFGGEVSRLINRANKSAKNLIDLLGQHFNSYRDVSKYRGKEVSFMKRAQLFIGDVWTRFGGQGLGEFNDIETLTMLADYRVPQTLQYLGVLQYSKSLMELLENGEPIPAESDSEIEIRGCSIWAVELIRQKVVQSVASLTHNTDCVKSILIDHYLWNYAKQQSSDMIVYPIHRTKTVFY